MNDVRGARTPPPKRSIVGGTQQYLGKRHFKCHSCAFRDRCYGTRYCQREFKPLEY